jgi:broad-specificity NMP kinase
VTIAAALTRPREAAALSRKQEREESAWERVVDMRLILIGTEYTGKTTLCQGLMDWGHENGIHHHLDDHFSIPDCQMLKSEEDQKIMTGLPDVLKERFQRFQIAYHVRLINKYEHILLGGFHIEEAVYGPKYYYPSIGRLVETPRAWEAGMPDDTVLVYLRAKKEVIADRMKQNPHAYQVVPESDIEEMQEAFNQEYRKSWIMRKLTIDTSELSADGLLEAFLKASIPHLDTRDLLIRAAIA